MTFARLFLEAVLSLIEGLSQREGMMLWAIYIKEYDENSSMDLPATNIRRKRPNIGSRNHGPRAVRSEL
ncbi:MAG: hypothetical protein ACK5O9_04990 [Holosporales bacterium]